MLARLATVSVVALLSLSPQSQGDEIAALKREIAALKAQQAAMQRDIQAIKTFLQGSQGRQQGEDLPGVIGQAIPLAGEPATGSATAKVTLVEVSDYH